MHDVDVSVFIVLQCSAYTIADLSYSEIESGQTNNFDNIILSLSIARTYTVMNSGKQMSFNRLENNENLIRITITSFMSMRIIHN
jgi:hypothetical protein